MQIRLCYMLTYLQSLIAFNEFQGYFVSIGGFCSFT